MLALGIEVRCGLTLATAERSSGCAPTSTRSISRSARAARSGCAQLDYARPGSWTAPPISRKRTPAHRPRSGGASSVIGGGSAAIDVARSARRAGCEVSLLALEREAQMPAQREEVAEALEEGVALVDGALLSEAVDAGSEGVRARLRARALRARPARGAIHA